MRQRMMLLLAIGCTLSLGCATRLTPAGARVREGDVRLRTACEFLSIVNASDRRAAAAAGAAAGMTERAPAVSPGVHPNVMTRLRNATADVGGDAFLIVSGHYYAVEAEAYRCG